jgi:PAS domain S-box-containing protein
MTTEWPQGDGEPVERIVMGTEKKRAAEVFRESERRYRASFDLVDEGFCIIEMLFDGDGKPTNYRFLQTNRAFERQTGLVDAVGKTVLELAPGHERHWFETCGHVAMTGEPARFEEGGAALGRWYDVYAFGIDAPKHRHVAILFRDILPRKRAEMVLRESAERQAFLLELSDRLRSAADPQAAMSAAAELFARRLGLAVARYLLLHADQERFDTVGGYSDGRLSGVLAQQSGQIADLSPGWATQFRNGEAVFSDDHDTPPATEGPTSRPVGARSGSGVPLIRDGRLVAIFSTADPEPRRWTEADKTLQREVAERTWAAVERARAEAALRESEARLAAMLDILPIGVGMADMTGAFVRTNPAMDNLISARTHLSADAAPPVHWQGWHADGRPLEPQEFPSARALRGERVVPGIEMLRRGADGAEIWTNVAAVPLRDDQGRVVGQLAIVSDIDAQKRNEQAVRDSEERLRQFGEASQDILWIRDAETFQWEYLTPAFEAIYGLDRNAALRGDNMAGWLDLIVPEDRELAAANLARVRDGEWVTFEYRIQRPADGGIRWLRSTDFPIRDQLGRVAHSGGIGHDITEIKEADEALAAAEQRQRALLEGIPQLVWRAVDGGEWTWASPQWTEYTGQAEVKSHHWGWLDPLHPDDRERARQCWATAIETGGFEVDYRIYQAGTKSYRWFHTSATPVRDAIGSAPRPLSMSCETYKGVRPCWSPSSSIGPETSWA